MGVSTLEDVLFHFPLRYQDRTKLSLVGELREGMDAYIQSFRFGRDRNGVSGTGILGRFRDLCGRLFNRVIGTPSHGATSRGITMKGQDDAIRVFTGDFPVMHSIMSVMRQNRAC